MVVVGVPTTQPQSETGKEGKKAVDIVPLTQSVYKFYQTRACSLTDAISSWHLFPLHNEKKVQDVFWKLALDDVTKVCKQLGRVRDTTLD